MALLILIQAMLVRSLPGELLFYQVLKYSNDFNDGLNMAQVFPVLTPFVSPIVNIKRTCALNNADIWPLKTLNVHGIVNRSCLSLLDQHSSIYQSATVNVPEARFDIVKSTIESLRTKQNLLTIIFPDHSENFDQSLLRFNINNAEFTNIFNGIQMKQDFRLTMIFRFL